MRRALLILLILVMAIPFIAYRTDTPAEDMAGGKPRIDYFAYALGWSGWIGIYDDEIVTVSVTLPACCQYPLLVKALPSLWIRSDREWSAWLRGPYHEGDFVWSYSWISWSQSDGLRIP